ncbi:MAG: PhoH family protein [Candidatus Mcinerneyibacterium aminivorans]|uniref:PhoH-like protein n=1 Tax=Candidatus Mcinerneyibacterium aminivorans TaxID=2703815 RepID=A0A5D0MCB7_9BACT|nr:MAG: PhoH family protein [Candidatus Mcinerneyibacterium aminivorans]
MSKTETEQYTIRLPNNLDLRLFQGTNNSNLKLLRNLLDINFTIRNNKVLVDSKEPEDKLKKLKIIIDELVNLVDSNFNPKKSDIRYIVQVVRHGEVPELYKLLNKKIVITAKKKVITPKTLHQKEYVDSIDKFDIVFGIGPAGTGKTYLAVAKAVNYLRENLVKRVVLVRPAVEAGEKIGFLPGDIQEKVNPYLRPLYDALYEMLTPNKVEELISNKIIEIIPLAFMRGRTLNDAFIIMDEAQNATPDQMKMFLTRMGFGSKVIVTGDITQIDLPSSQESGLINAEKRLNNIDDIAFIYFSRIDVVRHNLVQKIIKAYKNES